MSTDTDTGAVPPAPESIGDIVARTTVVVQAARLLDLTPEDAGPDSGSARDAVAELKDTLGVTDEVLIRVFDYIITIVADRDLAGRSPSATTALGVLALGHAILLLAAAENLRG